MNHLNIIKFLFFLLFIFSSEVKMQNLEDLSQEEMRSLINQINQTSLEYLLL